MGSADGELAASGVVGSQQGGRMDDPALVRAVQAGDKAAYQKLAKRYRHMVLQAVPRWIPVDDREDVAIETWVAVIVGLASWDQTREFRPWLRAIALNCARAHHRSEMRAARLSLDLAAADSLEAPLPSADEMIDRKRAVAAREHFIATAPLTADEREVERLRELGIPYVGIAKILKTSAATVCRRHQSAMEKLKQAMGESISREVIDEL